MARTRAIPWAGTVRSRHELILVSVLTEAPGTILLPRSWPHVRADSPRKAFTAKTRRRENANQEQTVPHGIPGTSPGDRDG